MPAGRPRKYATQHARNQARRSQKLRYYYRNKDDLQDKMKTRYQKAKFVRCVTSRERGNIAHRQRMLKDADLSFALDALLSQCRSLKAMIMRKLYDDSTGIKYYHHVAQQFIESSPDICPFKFFEQAGEFLAQSCDEAQRISDAVMQLVGACGSEFEETHSLSKILDRVSRGVDGVGVEALRYGKEKFSKLFAEKALPFQR